MRFDPPQLRVGELSGRVYVITHGKEIDTPNGPGIEASRKYDVTSQLAPVVAQLLLDEGVVAAATDPTQSHPAATERVLRDALAAAFEQTEDTNTEEER